MKVRIDASGDLYLNRPTGEKPGRCHMGQGTCNEECVLFKEPTKRGKALMVGCIIATEVVDERTSTVEDPDQISFLEEK